MSRRYRTYTNQELLAALTVVNDDLGLASYRFGEANRSRQPYWRNWVRTLGRKKRSICTELARRGLLYDPKERWSHVTD
jgi:hypothetical protein